MSKMQNSKSIMYIVHSKYSKLKISYSKNSFERKICISSKFNLIKLSISLIK